MGRKILFVTPYPLKTSPSQRFRFEQYFSLLRFSGKEFRVSSFLDKSNEKIFSAPGNTLRKSLALIRGFGTRIRDLFRAPFYDFIFIHREATPIGPPFFEWFVNFILKKRIIYDFDDAIWLTDKVNESVVERMLKRRGKVKHICRWSYKVSCSNDYLRQFASAFNKNTVVMPTTVDTNAIHNPNGKVVRKKVNEITVGWTGSHSTLKYLKSIENVMAEIQLEHPHVCFLVIADRPPDIALPAMRFKKWNPDSEAADLLDIDIGVMPLHDDAWTRGKSGFKCIQYMALEIPAVASDIGVITEIIEDGVNGYLVRTPEEWKSRLVALIEDKGLRKRLGQAGREKILTDYSVVAHSSSFLALFE